MKVMTYEEFIERIKDRASEELGYSKDLMKFYPKGFTSDDPLMAECIKDANLRYFDVESEELLDDFLVMEVNSTEKCITQHRVATGRMYKKLEENDFDTLFKEFADCKKDIDAANIDGDRLRNRTDNGYESIKDQLILRPLNYNLHEKDLQGKVYKKYGDFVLALYQVLGDAGGSLVTSKITSIELEEWNMKGKEDEIIQDALENTARLYPACVYDQRTHKEENFMDKEFTREDITMKLHSEMILLSTFRVTNGAVALFYPGVMNKMKEIMGGAFVAVFMNINDVMIFDPEDPMAVLFLKDAVSGNNIAEPLSSMVYLIDENGINPGIVIDVYVKGKTEKDEAVKQCS